MQTITGGISSDSSTRAAINHLLDREDEFVARFVGGVALPEVLRELVLGIESQAAHALAVSVLLVDESGEHCGTEPRRVFPTPTMLRSMALP
jgi:hypothetical protein